MTPTNEETLQAERDAATGAIADAVRKARDAALEEAAGLLLAEAEGLKREMAAPDVHIEHWNRLSLSRAVREGAAERILALKSKP